MAHLTKLTCFLPYQPSQTLRSSGSGFLTVSCLKTKIARWGCTQPLRPFSRISFPKSVRAAETVDIFQRRLRTHLFNQAYNWFFLLSYYLYPLPLIVFNDFHAFYDFMSYGFYLFLLLYYCSYCFLWILVFLHQLPFWVPLFPHGSCPAGTHAGLWPVGTMFWRSLIPGRPVRSASAESALVSSGWGESLHQRSLWLYYSASQPRRPPITSLSSPYQSCHAFFIDCVCVCARVWGYVCLHLSGCVGLLFCLLNLCPVI